MAPPNRLTLLYGPYRPPGVQRGDTLFCEVRGTVTVGGMTDAPIPWPRVKKGGNPCLILCGDLAKAVRLEAEVAVAHHWGVCAQTVTKWRKALGVPPVTEGTLRLMRAWEAGRTDDRLDRARAASKAPAAVAKLSASLKGRVQAPATLAAARKANHHPPSRREKFRALFRERGNWLRPDARPWAPEEDALLGTASDPDLANRLGRAVAAVVARRRKDRAALRKRRKAAGLSSRALSLAAGLHAGKAHALECGREKSLGRDAVDRLAEVLGCAADDLARRGRKDGRP